MSIEAMKQALEALEAPTSPMLSIIQEDAITSLRQALANEALDKKAENARELGLDYEPVQAEKQEPVAIVSGYYGGQCVVLPTNPARLFNSGTAFYTTPQPQRERVVFPTMLRRMWSGGEVQAWLDENVNKEKNT